MKKNNLIYFQVSFLWFCAFICNVPFAFSETAASYKAVPPFVTRGSDSNVMLDLSVETPMQGAAYNDQFDAATGCGGRVSDGGEVGRCYATTRVYKGIFDPNKAYDYVGGQFVPVAATNADHSTANYYSGNFLNWATMTAIDEFRWALTGGRRTTDTLTETVIQRANMTLVKGHSWYPVKMISSGTHANVAPSTVTPFANAKIYIWSHGYQIDIGTTWGGHELVQNYNVKVKVCDPTQGLEPNCVSYNSGAYYKPEGLIQNNAGHMRFAAMSYANDDSPSRGGGILRANMKYVGTKLPDGTVNPKAEYGTNGIFIDNPDAVDGVGVTDPNTGITNSGVINYVNKFGAYGYKSYDPAGELFYECLNYFKHRGRTPEYADVLTALQGDYFPIIKIWNDPIEQWCQHNYIVGINDANPWLDKKLPGTYFTATPWHGRNLSGSDYGDPGNSDTALDVTEWTNTVGALEGLNNTSQCIGCTASNCDLAASNKIIPGLGEVMGTCPYPSKENSYYIAGMAYYAHTQDIRPDITKPTGERVTISTFMVDTQEYSTTPLVGRMNMLWLAGKFGGFVEKDFKDTNVDDNIYEPNLDSEWDADGDGVPDNYVLATDPDKLINGLTKVFDEISKRSSSATAASVISGSRSGEGAVYQSVFYPEYSDNATPRHAVTWAGSLHASFVDDLGRMREDTNQNGILDSSDKIFAFRKVASGTTVVDLFDVVGAVAERTNITLSASVTLEGKYFTLNNAGETFYIWFTVAGSGTDPKPSTNMTGIVVALNTLDSANQVATKTATAVNAYGAFIVPAPTTNTITITNATPGDSLDATAGTSGVGIAISQQGAGESTSSGTTGNVEDIKYLWNSNSYLNNISDANVIQQQPYTSLIPGSYTSVSPRRYIFTFIDANQNKIADSGEQRDFVATTTLPTVADLVDSSTIYPYIPVHSDSKALPSSGSLIVDLTGGNRDEFLQNQTQRVINYIRGQDQPNFTLTTGTGGTIPAFRSRKIDQDNNGTLETWRLGDIVYSSPTVVSRPFEANHLLYSDTSYATFAEKYSNRRTVVYTGANDGMLHAFNGGFYEDRFDVFPAVHDNKKDVQFLTQPKDKNGTLIASGFAAHPLGAELWAYIPYNLLPHLYWLTDPNYSHVYYADLKPRMFDAKIFFKSDGTTPLDADHPGGWGTILVGGMRFGGGKINVDMNRTDGVVNSDDRTMTSAYYILDVTNPEVPPTVLAELNFPHLGYTTCYPTLATFKDKKETATSPNSWYLIFGSGPAEIDGSPGPNPGTSLSEAISDQTAKLYVVDLLAMVKDKILQTVDTTGALSSASPYYYKDFTGDQNAFISDPITVDINLDYKADTVYFGTVSYGPPSPALPEWGGKLRRIVMKDDPDTTKWVGDSTLIDLETNHHQPITAAPTVGVDPNGNTWVFFGTGRYLVRDDATIADQQSYYAIKEPRVALDASHPDVLTNSYVKVVRSDLFESSAIEVNATSHLVSGGIRHDSTARSTPDTWGAFLADANLFGGWYYNFTHASERNVGQAALYGDLLTFTSYIPSSDVCAFEGSSYLYGFYYLTGTAPSNAAIHDVTNPTPTNNLKMIFLGSGLVSKPSIHVGRNDGSTVFVQTSDGSILTLKEDNPGQTKSGKTSWEKR